VADLRGKVVTFGARALDPDDTPKYLNGPETPVFRKGSLLFALDRARDGIRRAGEALLMEGYTDVLMAHWHGVDRAVAGMGTAFTPEQASLLRRFAPKVVLVYDGDAAGLAAADRAVDVLLERGLEVRIARLPEGRDVDEILLEDGKEAFEQVLARAEDLFAFKLSLLRERHDLGTTAGRARAAEALLATVMKVPSTVERDQLFREIAERLGGPETEAVLRRAAADRLAGPRPAAGRGAAPAPGGPQDGKTVAERLLRRDREQAEACLLAGVLGLPALRRRVYDAVAPEEFTHPVLRRLYKAVRGLEEQGRAYDARTLAGLTADDEEAAMALASLPEEATLEDRVLSQVDFLERRRREQHRTQEVLRGLVSSSPEGGGVSTAAGDAVPSSGDVGPPSSPE
jgi:DNA primase